MHVRDFFTHKNPSGDNSFKRAAKAGYKYRAYGENIAWYSSTRLNKMTKQGIANKIMYGEKGWWLSKKGHKKICYLQIMIERVWAYGYMAIKSGLHRI